MKILFVDDNEKLLEQAKIFLEKENENLKITTVQSSKKALEKFDEKEYDGIISDYKMPHMDGLEFLSKIREKEKFHIPFIIFTGKEREEVAIKALNLGADRYIQKGRGTKCQYKILSEAITNEVKAAKTKKSLKEREKKYSTVAENINVLISLINDKGEINYVNQAHKEILGYEPDELLGDSVLEYFHPRDKKKVKKIFEQNSDKKEVELETRFRSKDEGYRWIESSGTTFPNRGILLMSRDITKRKNNEENFENYKIIYKNILEEMEELTILTDLDGECLYVSNSHKKILGYEPEEIIGKSIFSFIHPEDKNFIKKEFNKGIQERYTIGVARTKTKDGNYRWIKVHGKFIPEAEKVLLINRDITELKEDENK